LRVTTANRMRMRMTTNWATAAKRASRTPAEEGAGPEAAEEGAGPEV
jgi:hypothetical protein